MRYQRAGRRAWRAAHIICKLVRLLTLFGIVPVS